MQYLKVSEIAKRLRVHPATVRRLIENGEIPAVYIGSQARVADDDLERYLSGTLPAKDAKSEATL